MRAIEFISEMQLFKGLPHRDMKPYPTSPQDVTNIKQMNGVYLGVKIVRGNYRVISMWAKDPQALNEFITPDEPNYFIGEATLEYHSPKFATVANPVIYNKFRRKGYGILFYKYALDELNLSLESHVTQTPGSAMIWSLLARDPKYKVYAIDKNSKPIQVIADGPRLYVGDMPVYNVDEVYKLRCVKK